MNTLAAAWTPQRQNLYVMYHGNWKKIEKSNLLTTILTIRICQLEFKMRNQFKNHRIMAQEGLPKKHFFGTGDCMFRKIPVFAVNIPILGASAMGCNQTSRYCPVGFQTWQRKKSPMSMINRRCPSFFSSALGGAIFTRHLLTCGSSPDGKTAVSTAFWWYIYIHIPSGYD